MKKLIGGLVLGSLCAAFAMGVHALPLSFTVDAQLNSSSSGTGVDTGITLSAGEMFALTVSPDDLWNAGSIPRWSNADGLVGNLYGTGSDETGQPFGTLIGQSYGLYTQNGYTFVYGALVGELSGHYFVVGTHFSGPAPDAGTLHLFYWDGNNGDNQGSVVATFGEPGLETSQVAVPEPGTFLLIGLGLAGLALRRRALGS